MKAFTAITSNESIDCGLITRFEIPEWIKSLIVVPHFAFVFVTATFFIIIEEASYNQSRNVELLYIRVSNYMYIRIAQSQVKNDDRLI